MSKRRRFTAEFKARVALAQLGGAQTQAEVCTERPIAARSERFAMARAFARFGHFQGLWPLFLSHAGTLRDLKHRRSTPDGEVEDVLLYEYRVVEAPEGYSLLELRVGTDKWVISLNDPYPSPAIREILGDDDLTLMWYSDLETR